AEPSGTAEGKSFLGFLNVSTDFTGHADFSATLSSVVASALVGKAITATATDPNGNTSEFSSDFFVVQIPIAPTLVPTTIAAAIAATCPAVALQAAGPGTPDNPSPFAPTNTKYGSGATYQDPNDFGSNGFGVYWGQDLGWTNLQGYPTSGT